MKCSVQVSLENMVGFFRDIFRMKDVIYDEPLSKSEGSLRKPMKKFATDLEKIWEALLKFKKNI